ncbi:IS1595 family transposase [Candidatus Poriferisodalis sp.]|uniref:IS1595 family transposase n=1 Tax=Candidatus Poriferisodalis sp. TaxID=3101277 RepID=UPI003B026438
MAKSAPGKHYRTGITLTELFDMFPTDAAAEAWFAAQHLKGISSMKPHRDLGVTQSTAWFMLHRIREAFAQAPDTLFAGPVEVDETYVGGKAKNIALRDRKRRITGRGGADKAIVVGVLDRPTGQVVAGPVHDTTSRTLAGIVHSVTQDGAQVFSDEHRSYKPLASLGYCHEAVMHSAAEYVRGDIHTSTIESLWSMFKRGYIGTYHHMSEAHLARCIDEFTGRHNVREMGTETQMETTVTDMAGKRLRYDDLIAA